MADTDESRASDPNGDAAPGEEREDGESASSTPDLSRITGRLSGPLGFVAIGVGVLAAVALLTVAKQGRALLLPIVLAVVLNFLLAPAVRAVARLGVPTPGAAALVLLSLLAVSGVGAYRLAGPALEWLERAPRTLQQAEYRLRGLKESMENVEQAAKQAEELAGGGSDSEDAEVTVREQTMSESLTRNARAAVAGGTIMVFLLFFLLASGDLFLRKLAGVLPKFRHRRNAVAIARRIESEISRYLSTMAAINVGLGCAVGAAMWLLDMPNPILWGVMAGTLNFVPYVGPLVGIVITGVVALTEFQSTGHAFAVPAIYLAMNAIEGYLVTPFVMGKRLALNPVALLIGVIFWGWLWGIPGALLAVPMVATMKIVSDHIEVLRPFGEFLGV